MKLLNNIKHMETYAETSLKPSSGTLFCRQYSIMKRYNSSEVFGDHLEMGLNCALFKSYKEEKFKLLYSATYNFS
jgi:hypothetical protein